MGLDYRNFKWGDQDAPGGGDGEPFERQWWTIDPANGDELAGAVMGVLSELAAKQSDRRKQAAVHAKLYGNVSLYSLNISIDSRPSPGRGGVSDRPTFNVIQSVIDAAQSKMTKNRPWPLFLTDGGDYLQQLKAKRLNKFMTGVYFENELYRLASEAFRDAALWGTGAVHIFVDDHRVKMERVLQTELFIDELEGTYGEPRQLHRIKFVDRSVLRECVRTWYADDPKRQEELDKAIVACDPAHVDIYGVQTSSNDLVSVAESWHLPDGPNATDLDPKGGRHTIVVQGKALVDDPYPRDRFPFAFFRWSKRPWGFWGQGLAEQLASIQLEMNRLLWLIQRSFQLAGSFKWIAEEGSIPAEHLNGTPGGILFYQQGRAAPQIATWNAVPQQYFEHFERMKQSAYEQAGISILSAQSKKPEGLDSGRALREFNDIESDRFMTVGQAYEQFFLDATRLSIEATRAAAGNRKYEVKVPAGNSIERVDWKKVDLDDDSYVTQIFPVSSFPSTPAGRMQTVTEEVQAGWLKPEIGRRLMNFPDLEAVETLDDSQEEFLVQTMDAIIEDGKITPPEPYDNLARGRELALKYYARGRLQGLDPAKLALLRLYISQVDDLVKRAADAAAAAAPPVPQASPQPPPSSDLIQNVPGIK